MRLVKRLLLWLALSVPLGTGVGVLLAYVETVSGDFLRSSKLLTGGILGAELGVLAGAMAGGTSALFRDTLRRERGSELLTGMVVLAGLLAVGFLLLHL